MNLLPGSAYFHVDELPIYAHSGSGEHLFIQLEKEGLTTDAVAEALAKACGCGSRDIGYAGRKDRHAVTTQWFSVRAKDDSGLSKLSEHLSKHGRVAVKQVTRHGNKLRLGHLLGNRFRLGLADVVQPDALRSTMQRLAHEGVRNRFGPQRFGINGANLHVARALAHGDFGAAVQWLVDPSGAWHWGEALPEGFRPGPEGRVLGALRKGAQARAAYRAAGDQLHDLIVSAAQSAIFNAVLDARAEAGLLHCLRIGDLGQAANGATFLLADGELDDTNRRAAPGVLEAFATGPLPGTQRLQPAAEMVAQEQQWSAATGMVWTWFAKNGALEAPGERRALLMRFVEAPTVTVDGDVTWISFALPSGGYATEVLAQCGIAIPADRRG